MMKFFRKHRKAVSPVIAVMLLVAVAVAAVGAYFIWFRSFQTQTQKGVQEASSGTLGAGMNIISISDDGQKYYVTIKNTLSSGDVNVSAVAQAYPFPTGSLGNLTVAALDGGTMIIAPGVSKTFSMTPVLGSAPSWFATGTTRTFTIQANNGEFVVTPTYADS